MKTLSKKFNEIEQAQNIQTKTTKIFFITKKTYKTR